MENKQWLYNASVYLFKSINIDEETETFVVATNKKWLSGSLEELEDFIQDCLPVDDKPISQPSKSGAFDDVAKILKDNIEKVQSDPKYVSQAKVVNQSVTNLINLAGMQLKFKKQLDD